MRPAIRVLHGEHLALKGIARILKMEAKLIEQGGPPDFELQRSIVKYIRQFPNRIHHPKEERYLFAALRRRHPPAAGVLDRLFQEHQQENQLIADFADALDAFERDGEAARAAFAKIAVHYAEFLEAHLALENQEVFPLAEEHLGEDDWAAIDAAFLENDDPMLGAAEKHRFEALHRRILGLGLPPMGSGHGSGHGS